MISSELSSCPFLQNKLSNFVGSNKNWNFQVKKILGTENLKLFGNSTFKTTCKSEAVKTTNVCKARAQKTNETFTSDNFLHDSNYSMLMNPLFSLKSSFFITTVQNILESF